MAATLPEMGRVAANETVLDAAPEFSALPDRSVLLSSDVMELFGGAFACLISMAILTLPVARYNCRALCARKWCKCVPRSQRVPVKLLAQDSAAAQQLLTAFWLALALRVVWLLLNAFQVLGKNSSQCLSGLDCSSQVGVTLVNRFAQIAFFVTASRVMKHLGFAAHCKAFGYLPWLVPVGVGTRVFAAAGLSLSPRKRGLGRSASGTGLAATASKTGLGAPLLQPATGGASSSSINGGAPPPPPLYATAAPGAGGDDDTDVEDGPPLRSLQQQSTAAISPADAVAAAAAGANGMSAAAAHTRAKLLLIAFHSDLKPKIEALPVMGWDLSHIAMDWWMIILQVVVLVTTIFAPIAYDKAYPTYEAYQLQVATMYLLLGMLYAIVGWQYRGLVKAWTLRVAHTVSWGCCCCTALNVVWGGLCARQHSAGSYRRFRVRKGGASSSGDTSSTPPPLTSARAIIEAVDQRDGYLLHDKFVALATQERDAALAAGTRPDGVWCGIPSRPAGAAAHPAAAAGAAAGSGARALLHGDDDDDDASSVQTGTDGEEEGNASRLGWEDALAEIDARANTVLVAAGVPHAAGSSGAAPAAAPPPPPAAPSAPALASVSRPVVAAVSPATSRSPLHQQSSPAGHLVAASHGGIFAVGRQPSFAPASSAAASSSSTTSPGGAPGTGTGPRRGIARDPSTVFTVTAVAGGAAASAAAAPAAVGGAAPAASPATNVRTPLLRTPTTTTAGGLDAASAAVKPPQLQYAPSAYVTFALCAGVIAGLFFLRTILFLYTPVTNAKMKGLPSAVLYPFFFYVAAEALTPLITLHLLLPDGLLQALAMPFQAARTFCRCCWRAAGAGSSGHRGRA